MSTFDQRIAAVRRFTRFYTPRIGALDEAYLDTPFSLAEGRVLYELANRERPTASELVRDLGIDPGYLSRILRGFERRGLLKKVAAPHDGRQMQLILTDAGRRAFEPVNAHSQEGVGAMLRELSEADQVRVVAAMRLIEGALGTTPDRRAPYILRPHQPGDMGWVVQAHGALYAREYGFEQTFEALVAEITAKFINEFDPACERCWIAEKDGEPVGSVFLVRKSKTVAKLRLLIVDPRARGLGIGNRLVAECIRFARERGYKKITLWTQSILTAARHIYDQAGFQMVASEQNHAFGQDLVSETWELKLT
ncbi:bifunctional helix-turn-helix transcriptional regulator/GNAT family N-acetyltransferase [Desertibaculum subflavum]|uniref:bifunctional helix-turn-helix transcriptional regulator/GNAT family N-acetyltransferase n=1 Tax=Desertibaculum subflavum TaxID=2268458 RepID=UPI000E669885